MANEAKVAKEIEAPKIKLSGKQLTTITDFGCSTTYALKDNKYYYPHGLTMESRHEGGMFLICRVTVDQGHCSFTMMDKEEQKPFSHQFPNAALEALKKDKKKQYPEYSYKNVDCKFIFGFETDEVQQILKSHFQWQPPVAEEPVTLDQPVETKQPASPMAEDEWKEFPDFIYEAETEEQPRPETPFSKFQRQAELNAALADSHPYFPRSPKRQRLL